MLNSLRTETASCHIEQIGLFFISVKEYNLYTLPEMTHNRQKLTSSYLVWKLCLALK